MPPKKAGRGKVKKTASGYRMPDHLTPGTMLTDLNKKQWVLGQSVGTGGFGEIYLATEDGKGEQKVVKIEPHENGPLFVEMHFYISAGKPEHLQEWKKIRKVKEIPHLPVLRGHGSYQHKVDDTYRFLVIDRLGKDLDKTFQNGGNPLPMSTVAKVTVQVVSALEYIHYRGYTHNDVKAANLLMGIGDLTNSVYLVDFGLCVKYMKGGLEGTHKEYKPDPRKAHDGTIEYLSRDAHAGCTSRRSDMEVLGYNIIHWLTGSLPWLPIISNPTKVYTAKQQFMSEVGKNTASLPKPVQEFFNYIVGLQFDDEPNYDIMRAFFMSDVKKSGDILDLGTGEGTLRLNVKKDGLSVKNHELSEKDKKMSNTKNPSKRVVKIKTIRESEGKEDVDPATMPAKRAKKAPTNKSEKVPRKEKSQVSGDEDMFTLTPSPKKTVLGLPKYQEAASQTSPAFVAAARAARKGLKALAQSEHNVRVDTPSKARSTAGKSRDTPNKSARDTPKRSAKSTPLVGEGVRNTTARTRSVNSTPNKSTFSQESTEITNPGISNPTPAMLAIIQKKQKAEEVKEGKNRKN